MSFLKSGGSAMQWIGGQWVDVQPHRQSVNPATGSPIGTYGTAGTEHALTAIGAAKETFLESQWRHDRSLRALVLTKIAERIERRLEDFVDIIALENGKISEQARFEASMAAPALRFNAALALTDSGRAGTPAPGRYSTVIREPVGVVGVIAPWNSPLALAIRSLAPALAAGNTAVVSLPHQVAQFNYLLAQVFAEVPELPAGAVSILTGGFETGDALVRSPDVPVISFTGGTSTGKAIAANAAANVKRVGLELGGKHASVVFDDADLELAVPKLVSALTVFAGQFCMTGSRLIVQSGIADKVRARLSQALNELIVGPAAAPDSQMGPIIDKENVRRIDAMVQKAVADGAKVIVRGGPVTEGPLADGAFYRPTLLEVSSPNIDIYQQEVFGPVLTMIVFDDEKHAIELANNNEYGLSSSVFTRDIDTAMRVCLQMDVGTVWVNDWAMLADQFEEGGYKSSGLGRTRGVAVMDDFVEYKHISLNPFTN
ncbi:aldehyde dehydrogenase family protein [Mycobacteroides abscessus]